MLKVIRTRTVLGLVKYVYDKCKIEWQIRYTKYYGSYLALRSLNKLIFLVPLGVTYEYREYY